MANNDFITFINFDQNCSIIQRLTVDVIFFFNNTVCMLIWIDALASELFSIRFFYIAIADHIAISFN